MARSVMIIPWPAGGQGAAGGCGGPTGSQCFITTNEYSRDYDS